MSNTQTLKSANTIRVDVSSAQRIASDRFNGGYHHYEPANVGYMNHDVYNRLVGVPEAGVGFVGNGEYQPSPGAMQARYGADRVMAYETNQRPYTAIAHPGNRGVGDLMGVGRDLHPQNLYPQRRHGGTGFVRVYQTPNNAPPPAPACSRKPPHRKIQPYRGSMDAAHYQWRG